MHILAAASIYAEEHPEWFTKWNQYGKPCDALDGASWEAQLSGHAVFTATFTLTAAASVATHHPHLFGVLQ